MPIHPSVTPIPFPQSMILSKKASYPLKDDPTVRRSHLAKELVTVPHPDIDTVADVLPYCAKTYGDSTAALTRSVIEIVEEKKQVPKKGGKDGETEEKTWKYFTLSKPNPVSYNQILTSVKELSSGLRHLGLGKTDNEDGEPERDETGRDRAAVYADTSLNWQLMSHSLARMGHPLTTAYTTLGPEGLQHSLAEPSVKLLFTNSSLLSMLLKVLPDTPTVKWVVYDLEKDADQEVVKKLGEVLESRGGKIVTLEEVLKLGRQNLIADGGFGKKPERGDLFCIMYTSGSTGPPKGVMLTHNNIICSLAGTNTLLGTLFKRSDTFMAFLPLAHIMELLVELTFYFCGVQVAYGGVKTLTNESVRNCEGDLVAYKPTIMVGVPTIYETIRKGMIKKINEGGPLVKNVFNFAYSAKRNVPFLGGIIDKAIFAKAKEATGGRLRLAMNGGAALTKSTQEFLSTVLVTTLQGYGCTETCGMAAILVPEFFRPNSVGVIVPSMEVKLVDYPEAGYFSSNNQGEVWLRGGSVTKGYYKRDDENEKSFSPDGWFKTGDVGQFNPDGTLSLIDRIKNLVKTKHGEYLALEKCESAYGGCNLVANICVYADSEHDKPVAVLVPHEGNLRAKLDASGIKHSDHLDEVCEDPKVRDVIFKELLATGKAGGLKGSELLAGIVLTALPWTPENYLTAAMKLNRSKVGKGFSKEIKAAYGDN